MARSLAHLEAADRSLVSGDAVSALDELLDAWRASKCAATASAVARLGQELDRSLPPLDGLTTKRGQEVWIDVADAGRSADVGRLLVGAFEGQLPSIAVRAEALVRRPADPRIAAAFAEIAASPRSQWMNGRAQKVWRQIYAGLAVPRDPAMRPILEGWIAQPKTAYPWFTAPHERKLQKVLDALDPEAALEPAEVTALEAISRRIDALAAAPPMTPNVAPSTDEPPRSRGALTEGELLDIVAGAPDDDGPRHVLADHWLAKGDPRGELMALQLRAHQGGKVTGVQRAREKQLVRALGAQLVGPLVGVLDKKTLRFERGLLAACTTKFRTAKQRAELASHRAWSTVVDLTTDEPSLVTGGATPALRVLRAAEPRTLAAVCESTKPVSIREAWFDYQGRVPARAVLQSIAEARACPALDHLGVGAFGLDTQGAPVGPQHFDWLFNGSLARRLAHLTLDVAYDVDLGAWVQESLRPLFPRLDLTFARTGVLDLHRGERGAIFRMRIAWGMNAPHALATLDPSLVERIDVEWAAVRPIDSQMVEIQRELARFGDAVHMP